MEGLNVKRIQPRTNTIVTTGEKFYTEEEYKALQNNKENGGLLFPDTAHAKNLHKLIQKVIAVGPVVHDVKVGDYIKINPLYYLDRKLVKQRESLQHDILDVTGTRVKESYSELDYKLPTITLNGEECLLLFDRDVDYIVLEATEGDREYITNRNE